MFRQTGAGMQKSPRASDSIPITHSPHGRPSARATGVRDPTPELLDRALAGWERFLDSLEGASDE